MRLRPAAPGRSVVLGTSRVSGGHGEAVWWTGTSASYGLAPMAGNLTDRE
jgi:hypothetical protein